MKNAFVSAIAACGLMVTASAASAATINGLNGDLLTDPNTTGSWYFNFTAQPVLDHHIPDGITPINLDYTTGVGGSLDYTGAIRPNDLGITSDDDVIDIGLSVTGFNNFNVNSLFDSPQIIRHDYWNGRLHNGIGVMTEGTSDEEQVNYVPSQDPDENIEEYLRLSFKDPDTDAPVQVSLQGLDFASGEHHACGLTTSCGSLDIFAYDPDTGTVGTPVTRDLGAVDFVTFGAGGILGSDFLLVATNNFNATDGELGWYLSGVAGDLAPIPLPPALLLFLGALTGLGGIGFLKRRERSPAV